jgi:hypothetical protein
MTKKIYYLPGVNPEPWAIGPLSVARHGVKTHPIVGPNLKLQSFQNEVKDELERIIDHEPPSTVPCAFKFFFWRRLDTWVGGSGRKSGAHAADATNLQKGLEDALQGILITNDRNVQSIYSEIVEQGPDVSPGIIIVMESIPESCVGELELDAYVRFNIDRNAINQLELENGW